MTENEAIKLLSDKEEFGKWLERGRWTIKKCDEINRELEQYRAIGTIEELLKSVREEDVLKFYYIESQDKYVVGKRVDNFYYAEVGKTGLAFYMSRYLPWGEHGYSSEPKEIPFFDWLQGLMKKEYGGTIEEFKDLKEKSVAKKPSFEGDGYYNGQLVYDTWICPCCDKRYEVDYEEYEHCPSCGQKIDWGD